MKNSLLILVTLLIPLHAKSNPSKPSACRLAYDKAEAAAGSLVEGNEYRRYPDSKKKSLALASALGQYPGNLDESRQPLFQEILTSKTPESLDLSPIFAPSDCPIVRYFTLAKASLDSVTAYTFTDEEKKIIRDQMVAFLRKDFDGPMILIQFHMGVNLIERMQERGLTDKAILEKHGFAEIKKSLSTLVTKERKAMKPWDKVDSVKAYQRLPPSERAKFNEAVVKEASEVEKLRIKIKPLLADLG